MNSGIPDMSDVDDTVVDEVDTEAFETLDWSDIDPDAHRLADTVEPIDDVTVPVDAHPQLLRVDAPLDPERQFRDVAELHPDRLRPADPADQRRLEDAFAEDPSPETLVEHINPGHAGRDDMALPGRTTNCADCARAFQDGLEGRPRVAAEISPSGLPSDDYSFAAGENRVYTEQWAGERSEQTRYEAVEAHLTRSGGSAILMASGRNRGHAFNAFFDYDTGRVKWADAQQGIIGDWPPPIHVHPLGHYTKLSALYFGAERRQL